MAENRNEKEVLLKVRTDTSEANSGLEDVKQKIQQANETARELSRVDYGAMSVKELKEQLDKAEMSMEQLVKSGNATEASLKVIGDRVMDIEGGLNNINANKAMDSFEGSMRTAIGAVEMVGGALTFVGVESETANVALARMAGLMSFSNGIKDVMEYGRQIGLTQKAVGLWTSAQKSLNVALNSTRSALVATGIGAAIVAIALLIQHWDKLTEALGFGKKEIEETTKAHDLLVDSLNTNEYKKVISDLVSLEVNVSRAKKGLIDKETVLKQYNETVGKSAGELSDFNDLEDWMVKNTANYVKSMRLRAAANLLLQKTAEDTIKLQEAENTNVIENASEYDKLYIQSGTKAGDAVRDKLLSDQKTLINGLKNNISTASEQIEQLLTEADALIPPPAVKKGEDKGKDLGKKIAQGVKEGLEENLVSDEYDEAFDDLFKKAIGYTIESNEQIRIANGEARNVELENLRYEYSQKEEILKKAGLSTKALLDAQRLEEQAINKRYDAEDIRLAAETEMLKAETKYLKDTTGLDMETTEGVNMDENARLEALKTRYEAERAIYAEDKEMLNYLSAKYESDKTKIEEDGAEARKRIAEAEKNAKLATYDAVSGGLSALGELAGESTAAGKALGVASAVIDTYVGANKALAQGGFAGIAMAGAVIATGLLNVKKIMSTKVEGVRGNRGDSPAPSGSRTAPVINTTVLNRGETEDLNSLGNNDSNPVTTAPIRAYIVSSDLSKDEDKRKLDEKLSTF